MVIKSINCYDRCYGCRTLCPTGAITYFGDPNESIPTQKKIDRKILEFLMNSNLFFLKTYN